MVFKVVGMEKSDNDSGRVKLEAKDGKTIFTSQVYMHVPIAELSNYRFGMEFVLHESLLNKPVDAEFQEVA